MVSFSSHPGADLPFLLSCVWQKKGRVLSCWFPRQPSRDEPKEATGVGAGDGAQSSAKLVTIAVAFPTVGGRRWSNPGVAACLLAVGS